jgi:kynureninase
VSAPTPDLSASPNPLAPDYSRFRVEERILLTGHSHQAWPDVARGAVLEAWDDAAEHVDTKWERAFARAERVREGVRLWLDDPRGEIALGQSTHELVLRFLSALDLARRPRLVTTDGEFHSIRRQLARLAEAGLEIRRIPTEPVGSLAERLASAVDDRTAAALVSAVLFESGRIVGGLAATADACARRGAELFVDAYHAVGCLPYPLAAQGLDRAWVVGGGYKYLQWGEGNAFLRLPAQAARARPVVTGWFAEFELLEERPDPARAAYPDRASGRFAGSTYDPVSHYRAARVAEYFATAGLTPETVRANYQRQLRRLAERLDALDLPPNQLRRDAATPLAELGGFLALVTPHAAALRRALARRGVAADHRGDRLRLGPAPYLSNEQLDEAVDQLGPALRELAAAPA